MSEKNTSINIYPESHTRSSEQLFRSLSLPSALSINCLINRGTKDTYLALSLLLEKSLSLLHGDTHCLAALSPFATTPWREKNTKKMAVLVFVLLSLHVIY